MLPEPRRQILRLLPAVHGGLDLDELQRLGLNPDEILDFSTNINPYGPSPTVRAALAAVSLERYPDPQTRVLRSALEESLAIPREHILPGNGASELIGLAAMTFVRPGDRVLVLGPTFCEYDRAATLLGARVAIWESRAKDGFAVSPDEVSEQLRGLRPRIVFMCNPNNPTGAAAEARIIAGWSLAFPQTLFVIDEAYWPFALGMDSAQTIGADNVLVLRSLTKDLGLAGLRLGYALGCPRLIALLAAVQPPWSVNALAQMAGVAALKDTDHWPRCRELLCQAKDGLVRGLERAGLAPFRSTVHFFLVPVGNGSAVRQALLRRGILVRDGTSFGLPEFIRVAPRRPAENDLLVTTLQEVL